jgi:hypothetical protein
VELDRALALTFSACVVARAAAQAQLVSLEETAHPAAEAYAGTAFGTRGTPAAVFRPLQGVRVMSHSYVIVARAQARRLRIPPPRGATRPAGTNARHPGAATAGPCQEAGKRLPRLDLARQERKVLTPR